VDAEAVARVLAGVPVFSGLSDAERTELIAHLRARRFSRDEVVFHRDDAGGHLYVTDALAGWSGIYRVRLDAPASPELVLAGGTLIGLAFDPHGGLAIATSDSVYRLAVGVRGLLPLH